MGSALLSVWDLVASSGEVADCTGLNIPSLALPFAQCRTTYGGYKTCMKHERPYLKPLFGLSILGYCRNIGDSMEKHLLPP